MERTGPEQSFGCLLLATLDHSNTWRYFCRTLWHQTDFRLVEFHIVLSMLFHSNGGRFGHQLFDWAAHIARSNRRFIMAGHAPSVRPMDSAQ